MLFISPEYRGCGVGAKLTDNAIRNQKAEKVDVNEQNHQASDSMSTLDSKPADGLTLMTRVNRIRSFILNWIILYYEVKIRFEYQGFRLLYWHVFQTLRFFP